MSRLVFLQILHQFIFHYFMISALLNNIPVIIIKLIYSSLHQCHHLVLVLEPFYPFVGCLYVLAITSMIWQRLIKSMSMNPWGGSVYLWWTRKTNQSEHSWCRSQFSQIIKMEETRMFGGLKSDRQFRIVPWHMYQTLQAHRWHNMHI